MPQLDPTAHARAIGHLARIAVRMRTAGVESDTLTRLEVDLAAGPIRIPSDRLDQLQFRAAELEMVLIRGQALHLAGTDLANLRLILTGETTTIADDDDSAVVELRAEMAAALTRAGDSTYRPGVR